MLPFRAGLMSDREETAWIRSLEDAMKTMVIVALIVMPPRPRKCHAVLYPVQFWGTDGSGRTVTWVAYTPYYVCY